MAKAVKLSGIIDVYLQMKISKEIVDELANISSVLAGIEKKNVFSVPEGYFEMLSFTILKSLDTSPSIDTLTVPDGYFENLSSSIMQKIRSLNETAQQELRTLSPMLYSIQNENVFEVPAGYFKNLQNDILDKVVERPTAKVIELKKRNSVWKYAAAAVVTGVIGVSSLMMFDASQNSGASNLDESISSSIQTASQFKDEQQINAAIASLPDDDVIKYLERTGNEVDNEALATSVNENELPATNDYLLDEGALNNYLDKKDKNSQN
ncbi:MAG: hypothetical protein ABIQ07_02130 [Ginsengibacter sp.]